MSRRRNIARQVLPPPSNTPLMETPPPRGRAPTTSTTNATTITPTRSSPPRSSKKVQSPRALTKVNAAGIEVMNLHEDDDNMMGGEFNGNDDEEVVHTTTASKRGAKTNIDDCDKSEIEDGTKYGGLAIDAKLVLKTTETSGDNDVTEDTPSPPRVILDLIDATCHEIIHLGGGTMNSNVDDDEVDKFIMPACTSYANLAQRLRYYMSLLKQGYPNGEQQQQQQQQQRQAIVLEKGTDVWFRLVMAKLILDIFSKEAYPPDDEGVIVDGKKQIPPPSLMDMSSSRWSKLRWAFTELRDALRKRDEQESLQTGKIWKGAESLICAMEGFEALVILRKQLRGLVKKIASGITNDDDDNKRSILLNRAVKYVGQYNDSKNRIKALLEKEGFQEYYAKLFVPSCPLHCFTSVHYYPLGLEELGASISFILFFIDMELKQKRFSVPQFKCALLNTLKHWERCFLPKPVLFNVGCYFNFNGEEESSFSVATHPQVVVSHTEFTPEKDVEMKEMSRPATSSHRSEEKICPKLEKEGMRAKRIPFTLAEKECLLKGVEKFGVGRWADILEHYQEVFGVNQRSNVNLKDLYRTLTKKNKSNND